MLNFEVWLWGCKSKSCKSRQELSNQCSLPKVGVDAAENKSSEACMWRPQRVQACPGPRRSKMLARRFSAGVTSRKDTRSDVRSANSSPSSTKHWFSEARCQFWIPWRRLLMLTSKTVIPRTPTDPRPGRWGSVIPRTLTDPRPPTGLRCSGRAWYLCES